MSKPKMRNVETGCGKALVIVGAIIIVVYTVALALFLTYVFGLWFGLWPDWALEAWKAWMR